MKKFYYLIFSMALSITFSLQVMARPLTPPDPANTAEMTASATAQAQEREAFRAAARTKEPAERVAALQKFIVDFPQSAFKPVAQIEIFKGLLSSGKEEKEFMPFAEEGLKGIPDGPPKVQFLNDVAYTLAEAGKGLDQALKYSEQSLALLPAEVNDESRANFQDTLGWIHFKRGNYNEAIKVLETASKAADTPDIFEHLAQAYEKGGQSDKSISAWVKAVGYSEAEDEEGKKSREAGLKAAYVKKNGSEKGLSELVAAEEASVLKDRALVKARYEEKAPEWSLKNLAGETVKFADLKGKVVVLDWWGSWCPPCRLELPHFQKLYEAYKDKGVVFIGVNWEQPNNTPEKRQELAKKFLKDNSYTFPVVLDPEMEAGEQYKIRGFPTVFVIDGTGQIRYRTVGYSSGVSEMIEMQIKAELDRKGK